ncbi:RdRP-domain-containing protein [Daedalea quercina L-15889]|uniref:RNA-dependent RNA polymerase n=1 Tax=Daedalea quercina L-15889 TaxID=1314783 RepID=A0A165RX56_9APHY|nr:RdRP-domain-containing protein [Daedalea quercina L-15889]
MEIELADISRDATVWDVKRKIGSILHGDYFYNPTDPKDRPANFEVTLDAGPNGIRHNGSGVLTLGSRKLGDKFFKWLHNPGSYEVDVKLYDRKIRFFKSKNRPKRNLTQILEKAPYLPPEIEEAREDKIRKLDTSLHVDKIQFGIFFRPADTTPTAGRDFSSEVEISHRERGAGILWFEYEHKLIRIQMGDPMTEEIANNVAITFANIRKMARGNDCGNPFVVFELLTPPMLEKQRFNRELTGDDWRDNRKFRQRLSSINDAHAVVAPYAYHMRVIMHEDQDTRTFANLCKVAGLQEPIYAKIDASKRGFFSPRRLYLVRDWVRTFDWPFAFQIEALLHNGLLHTDDLLVDLRKPIDDLYARGQVVAADFLRLFTEALRCRDMRESPVQCFKRMLPRRELMVKHKHEALDAGYFSCHHVTFTPTRMLLEGPYAIQSNRVIRKYHGYQDHFIRVDFRDEDRLQYRWAREVDGTSLLVNRVGGLLKNGFELAGRQFEFLAYSQSALREHAVWFVNPFRHPEHGYVNAQAIRDSLGDFSGVIMQPSKYAARIAQAFTATDPSVKVTRDQWELVDDMGEKPYEFTDGVGTISVELGDMIWDALCTERERTEGRKKKSVKPSAYQIRFLGFKGMVAIDERLEGIKMRLRHSMNKFKALDEEVGEIEIARAFDRPGTCYLNRPLVMLMEDRGVDKKAFLDLQERTKREIYTASDSMELFVRLLKAHKLGQSFGLDFIIQGLRMIGMGFKHEKHVAMLQDPFISRLIHIAKNHVLRDVKHGARIPIPDSYLLVGVADEGPAYEQDGVENVYTLKKGEIFACIQHPDDPEPTYIKGSVVISRSPVVHPGDVQRVYAVGKPPDDKVCFFRNTRNVVVLPSTGQRSLASCLGGGDLDGDLYSIIHFGPLLPTEHADPASYEGVPGHFLDRPSTVDDICDFVVEYLNSDVLGLLSDRHLIIADQSKHGTKDERCVELARLCSQAVDYPKNGKAVDIFDSPRWLIPYKPDWHQAEDPNPRHTDYYDSARALGEMFRNIALVDPSTASPTTHPTIGSGARPQPLSDPISRQLRPYIEAQLHHFNNDDGEVGEISSLFQMYVEELRFICMTHSLSEAPEMRLTEEEVGIGSIIAKCSQTRWRSDRTHRMRLHASILARDIRNNFFKMPETEHSDRREQPEGRVPTPGELRYGLGQAWRAWDFSVRNKTAFGANTFGLIALRVIFDTLERLGGLDMAQRSTDEETDETSSEGEEFANISI